MLEFFAVARAARRLIDMFTTDFRHARCRAARCRAIFADADTMAHADICLIAAYAESCRYGKRYEWHRRYAVDCFRRC